LLIRSQRTDAFTFLNDIINKGETASQFTTINQIFNNTIEHITNDCEEYENLNLKYRKAHKYTNKRLIYDDNTGAIYRGRLMLQNYLIAKSLLLMFRS
jgi:hypothetical protein